MCMEVVLLRREREVQDVNLASWRTCLSAELQPQNLPHHVVFTVSHLDTAGQSLHLCFRFVSSNPAGGPDPGAWSVVKTAAQRGREQSPAMAMMLAQRGGDPPAQLMHPGRGGHKS